MERAITAFIFFIIIVGMFIITYVLNKRTPDPDIEVDMSGCNGCKSVMCQRHPAHNSDKKEID